MLSLLVHVKPRELIFGAGRGGKGSLLHRRAIENRKQVIIFPVSHAPFASKDRGSCYVLRSVN